MLELIISTSLALTNSIFSLCTKVAMLQFEKGEQIASELIKPDC